MFLPGIPWARRPVLLPNDNPQSSLYLGFFMRWRYSSSSSVLLLSTAPAKLARNSRGNFLLAACRAVGQLPEMSTTVRSFSRREALVFLAGWSSSIMFAVDGFRGLVRGPTLMISTSGELQRSALPISSSHGSIQAPSYASVSDSVASRVAAALSILALWLLMGNLTACATDFKMSISTSIALRVSPLTGVTPFNAAQRSSEARRRASVSMTSGWARYRCLKNTV